jgi:hypothetical protein
MIPAGSRYERADRQFVQAHIYNEWGLPFLEDAKPNYKVRVDNREATYLVTVFPDDATPPIEYYARDLENYPWLAYKFLGDAKRWWEICDVNTEVWYPLDLQMGTYLRIPT